MIELLRTRRSIRKYEKRLVGSEAIAILEEALLRCPSSRGINPWTFIFVDDPELLAKLSLAKDRGSAFLKEAPLAVVICGDSGKSDVWVEDCSIAAIVAHLVAHSLGLGSCWIQIRQRAHSPAKTAAEYVREVLHIPDHLMVEAIVSMGHPGEKKEGAPLGELDYGKIRHNAYA